MFEPEFLQQQGAVTEAEGHIGFPGFDPARDACPDTFITLPVGLTLLHVSGSDAVSFLHNQLTCDVEGLADGSGSTGAWCNPKGRVITTFLIYRLGNEFYLLLPEALRERVVKRLRLFVLRADVQIAEYTEARSIMAARGKADPIPESELPFSIHSLNERLHLFLPDRSGESRCLIVDATPALQTVWSELARNMQPVDSRCWEQLDLAAALVWIDDSTTEQFLPQELSLEASGGLVFNKGCYPGQEVVARVHYRGQVKRRLYQAHIAADTVTAAGDKLKDADGRTVGTVVAVSALPAGERPLLAVVDNAAAQGGVLHLEGGAAVSLGACVSPD